MLSSFSKFLPQLTRIKNEIVWYLALAAGVVQFLIVQVDGLSFDDATDWFGIGTVLLGFVQRANAYGQETVEQIRQRTR